MKIIYLFELQNDLFVCLGFYTTKVIVEPVSYPIYTVPGQIYTFSGQA